MLCAGEGSLFDEVGAQVEKRGLSDCIQMLGYRTDIKELIGVSDIGILLSYRERITTKYHGVNGLWQTCDWNEYSWDS